MAYDQSQSLNLYIANRHILGKFHHVYFVVSTVKQLDIHQSSYHIDEIDTGSLLIFKCFVFRVLSVD